MKRYQTYVLALLVVFSFNESVFTQKAVSKPTTLQNECIYYQDSIRPAGQKSVLGLRVAPIPTVRVGFIGLGMRGVEAVRRFTYLGGVEIKALCDLEKNYIDRAQALMSSKNLSKADEYIGETAWKKLCERKDIDLIYICTDWLTHTPMAVYAMEQGKHVAVEVPAAVTVKECWDLVNTAEKTQRIV